jgi:hypothetical protein
MTTITARSAGRCPTCGGEISEGDRITLEDITDLWSHEECPEGDSLEFDPTKVCGECFTVRSVNGACSCVS